jgi:nucleotide-binding universal stress UspA family protein
VIKDIVCHIAIDSSRDAAAPYAVSVAEVFSAHICGVAFAYEPVLPAAMMNGGLPIDFVEAQRVAAERAASDGIAKFENAVRRTGISSESRVVSATLSEAAAGFGQMARRFDLAVVGQADPDAVNAQHLIIEAALFQSGRPVLVVPYIQSSGLTLENVLVCWDGSRNAARAVGDALPFLARAKAITVLVVASKRLTLNEPPGADIAHHLARHGLPVDLKRIVSEDVDVANIILSYAADASADFIVMGGYGHSRLREFILGGVTRGILSSMTVPALLSH